MGKHHRKSSNNNLNSSNGLGNFGGFNIGELLKNIDLNQVISLLSSFTGAKNMSTDQLSSIIRNLDLNEVNRENNSSNLDIDNLKSQLSILADRLDQVEGGKSANVHDELMKAVKNLQDTPGGQDAVYDLIKSNFETADEDRKDKKRKK